MAGGYDGGRKIRKMTFDEGSDFPGLWLRTKGMTIDEWMGLAYPEALELFVERLVEWNWEIDGEPTPPTLDGVKQLDASDIRTLISVWSDTCAARRDANPLVRARSAVAALAGSVSGNGSSPGPDVEMEMSIPTGPPPNDGNGGHSPD